MLCIMCLLQKPRRRSGGEHVFPYGIGGSFTIDRVCEDCDNHRGNDADAGLIKQEDIEERRIGLGLRGRNGSVPDPVGVAIRRPHPHPERPDERVKVSRATDGTMSIESVTFIDFQVIDHAGALREIRATDNTVVNPRDNDTLPQRVRSALKKRGVTDEKTVEDVIRGFIASLETHHESVLVPVPIRKNRRGHQRGLLKIAYEMAWYWLGDTWLEDATAVAMREVLNGDMTQADRISGDADVDVSGLLTVMGVDAARTHMALIYIYANRLTVAVRLLDAHCVAFFVSDTPANYAMPNHDIILLDAVDRTTRHASLETVSREASAP